MGRLNYQWLLFDADNTLFDFDRSEKYALSRVFQDFGLEYNEELGAIYHRINSMCWKAFEDGDMDKQELRYKRFELFFDEIGKHGNPVEFSKRYLGYLAETGYMIPGAYDLLGALSIQFQLAIITNGLKEVQRPRLRQSAIDHFFQVIVVSDEIGHSKPNAAFFSYTFEQMGQPDKGDTLVIGDSLNSDIRGGHQYGLDTCWYNPAEKENTGTIDPTFIIKDLDEIKQIIGLG